MPLYLLEPGSEVLERYPNKHSIFTSDAGRVATDLNICDLIAHGEPGIVRNDPSALVGSVHGVLKTRPVLTDLRIGIVRVHAVAQQHRYEFSVGITP